MSSKSNERWKFVVWIAALLMLVFILSTVLTAWVVRHVAIGGGRFSESQIAMVNEVAEFVPKTRAVLRQIIGVLKNEPFLLLIDKPEVHSGLNLPTLPAPEDRGYLLLAGVDAKERQSIVKLIRLSDGSELMRWSPDWSTIISRSTKSNSFNSESLTVQGAQAIHPLMMSNGDIIFNTNFSMVRMGVCSGQPVWVLNEISHHSIELDNDGNVLALSVVKDGFGGNKLLQARMRDDALTWVSPEGQLLKRISFSDILLDNGLRTLLLGSQGMAFNPDPIHLNQVSVARESTRHWQKGDLLISARHLSTVFLYRPSTSRIVWYHTGPWLNQHSAAFVGNHQISVFDNNVFTGLASTKPFLKPEDSNRVMIFDFETGKITEPFAEMLKAVHSVTVTAGRAQILPDGGLFVEETNFARHFRFSRDKLLWARTNGFNGEKNGLVSWSRYMAAEEVEDILENVRKKKCH